MPYLSINDCKIFFEIYGGELDLSGDIAVNKPTILCLHDGTGLLDHTYEVPFWKNLADSAQVILLDFRGLGRSSRSRPDLWKPTQWADDVYQFARGLGLSKPVLAGDSLGGQVAMLAGSRYPGFWGGLVLINTETQLNRDEIIEAFKAKGGDGIAKIAHEALYDPTPQTMQEYTTHCLPLCTVEAISNETYKHCNLSNELGFEDNKKSIWYSMDLTHEASKIVDPVLFIASDSNPFHNLKAAERSIETFSPEIITSEIVPNTGLVQFDAPTLLQNRIEVFLDNCTQTITKLHQPTFPDECDKGVIQTVNKMGITTLEKSPPTEHFLDYTYYCKKPVLDIGCGFGVSTIAALKTGAKVIALDMADEHLQVIRDNVPAQFKKNLTTMIGRFPQDLNLEPNSLSAAHASMILHFLTGEEIMEGLRKLYSYLEPGGRLFMGNMTPHLGIYEKSLSETYNERRAKGENWPGYIYQIPYAKEPWKYKIPEFAHFFKLDTAIKMVTQAGFEVEKAYYYTLDNIPDLYKTNGKEYVGVTAIKE